MKPEELVAILVENEIVDKAAVTAKTSVCQEITAFKNETPIAFYIYKARFTDKIIIKILSKTSNCMEALIEPTGLYTIPPKTPNQAYVNTLKQKIKVIIKIHKQQVNI